MMRYHVIYDGNCNLCVTFTQLLEQFDRGNLFDYIPMQDEDAFYEITESPAEDWGANSLNCPTSRARAKEVRRELGSRARLAQFGITADDCQMGMILIDSKQPEQRWQGSDAAEEIVRTLPLGEAFIAAYRAIPGMKWTGDRVYEQVRDRRYNLFGKRDSTYYSQYPFGCQTTDPCQSP